MLPPSRSLHEAIGLGITNWRRVEDHLYFILQAAMEPAHVNHVHAIWAAARHFETKLRICDGIISGHPNEDVVQTWSTLNNRLGRNAKARHRLAHTRSYVKIIPWAEGEVREEGDLDAIEYMDDGLTTQAVDQIAAGFSALEDDLWKLLGKVRGWTSPDTGPAQG